MIGTTSMRLRAAMAGSLLGTCLISTATCAGVLAGALFLGPSLSLASDPDRGSVTSQTSSVDEGKFRDPRPAEVVASPPYPVNKNGQTYGSGMNIDAHNPGPDLIAAYGTNGAFGYIRAIDRAQPATGLVTDFIEQEKTSVIRLYAADGETVAGEFAIVPRNATSR